jgi:hypothetical protein
VVKLWGSGPQSQARDLTLAYWQTASAARREEIQAVIESRIRGMYAWRLAETIDRTVWATPPGWYSTMDLPRWWRVSPEFTTGPGAAFYRDVLGARIDPTGYVGINRAMLHAPNREVPADTAALKESAPPFARVRRAGAATRSFRNDQPGVS